MFGYRPKTTGVAQTSVDFYQQLPSINDGTGNYVPDYSYAITINENAGSLRTKKSEPIYT